MSDLTVWEAPTLTPWEAPASFLGGVSSRIKEIWQNARQCVRELSLSSAKAKATNLAERTAINAVQQSVLFESTVWWVADNFPKGFDLSSPRAIVDLAIASLDDLATAFAPQLAPPIANAMQRYVFTIPSIAQGIDIVQEAMATLDKSISDVKDIAVEAGAKVSEATAGLAKASLSHAVGGAVAAEIFILATASVIQDRPIALSPNTPAVVSRVSPQAPTPAP